MKNGKCDIVCEAILAMRGAKKYSRWWFWVWGAWFNQREKKEGGHAVLTKLKMVP